MRRGLSSFDVAVPYGAGHGQGGAGAGGTEARRVDRDQALGFAPVLAKGDQQRIWAYHDGVDLGGPAMARIARDYGYTLAELRKLQDDLVMSELRVELFFDEEAGNWHYRVPALHINGGGTLTREAAENDCLSAIAFALEGDPRDYDTDAETLTFDVNVAPAA
jgi:hypothetical protein